MAVRPGDLRGIARMVREAAEQLRLVFALGVLRRTDDRDQVQTVQLDLLAGETKEGLRRLEDYGMTGHVPTGAAGVEAFPGGDRSSGYVLALMHPAHRPRDLPVGDVAFYRAGDDPAADAWAARHRITFTTLNGAPAVVIRSGDTKIDLLDGEVRIESPQVTVVSPSVDINPDQP